MIPGTRGYDALDRLVQETLRLSDGTTRTVAYAYDAQGNRTEVQAPEGTTTFSYNPAGQLVASEGPQGATTYLYDLRGNLMKAIGPAGATTYAWTPEGRLTGVTLPSGAQVSYAYDAEGRRVEKRVGGSVTTYAYDAGRLAAVTTSEGVATFAYDPSGVPLRLTWGGETYALRVDERGSVIELTDTATHAPAARLRYDAWGQAVEETGDAALLAVNPYRFVGAHGVLYDPETGLHQMGARYYDAEGGRFISRDPAEAEVAESSYVYARNNPAAFVDATGLHAVKVYRKYRRLIVRWARHFRLAPLPLAVLLQHEGGGRENILSRLGGRWQRSFKRAEQRGWLGRTVGIGQMNPETARRLARKYLRIKIRATTARARLVADNSFAISLAAAQIRDLRDRGLSYRGAFIAYAYSPRGVGVLRRYKGDPYRIVRDFYITGTWHGRRDFGWRSLVNALKRRAKYYRLAGEVRRSRLYG